MIDAGYNVGFQSLLRKLPVMNAGEYARLYNLIRSTQTGDGNVPVPVFTDQQIAGFPVMVHNQSRTAFRMPCQGAEPGNLLAALAPAADPLPVYALMALNEAMGAKHIAT